MKLGDLYAYYGCNWTQLCRELDIGNSTYQAWRNKGYIPFKTQLLIENQTNGLFKASREDAEPRTKRVGRSPGINKNLHSTNLI